MKKTLVIVLALALVLSACALTLTACSGKVYEGEYSYFAWDYAKWSTSTTHKYGCKVKVTIQGGVITNVVVAEDTDEFYNVSATWTGSYTESGYDSEGKTNWRLHGQEMADSFVGLTTDEVLKMKVYVAKYDVTVGDVIPKGQPVTTENVETIKYIPSQLKAVIGRYGDFGFNAGATQSAARLVLAVQDAILKSQGKTTNPNCVEYAPGITVTGECSYPNAWNPSASYGVKVDVTVKDGVITGVKLYTDEETGWTRTSGSWRPEQNPGDLGFEAAEAAYEGWIKANIVGQTVAAAKAWVASATQEGQTVTSGPKLAGATQSSARIIVAVQNALAKLG